MTLKVEVSTHPRDEDKFVRLTTDRGVIVLSMMEWTYAISHVGKCSPSGRPVTPPPGGTPVAARQALVA